MRKYFLTAAIAFILLNSCSVQKKQYYIFDWYRPGGRDSTQLAARAHTQKLQPVVSDTWDTMVTSDNAKVYTSESVVAEVTLLKQLDQPEKESANTKKVKLKSEPASKAMEDRLKVKPARPRIGDGLMLLTAGLMALAVVGLTRLFPSSTTKLTRWAKANPGKTQGMMAGLQLPLMGLAVQNGYSLNQMGYEMSDPLLYGFGAVTAIGLMSVPFLPERNVIPLPKTVNRHRLMYTTVLLSSLMLLAGFGSRIEKNYPNTYLAQTAQHIDQSVFAPGPDKNEQQVGYTKFLEDRPAKTGISAGGAVFLIFLLISVACAGICLAAGAFGSVSALGVIGGLILIALSILGIINVSKARKKRKALETQTR